MRIADNAFAKESSEVPEGYKPFGMYVPEKKLSRNSCHLRIYQSSLGELARDKDLNGDALRVFLGVLEHLDYENKFEMTLKDLAANLGMHRPNVSKYITLLVKKGYLKVEKTIGSVKFYRLDPSFGFKNRVSKLERIQQEFDELPDSESA
jgi:DNA-binding transcriptional ArsR family regulator